MCKTVGRHCCLASHFFLIIVHKSFSHLFYEETWIHLHYCSSSIYSLLLWLLQGNSFRGIKRARTMEKNLLSPNWWLYFYIVLTLFCAVLLCSLSLPLYPLFSFTPFPIGLSMTYVLSSQFSINSKSASLSYSSQESREKLLGPQNTNYYVINTSLSCTGTCTSVRNDDRANSHHAGLMYHILLRKKHLW